MQTALVQLAVEPAARERNVSRAADSVREAAGDGADIVVLPELFTVGYFAFDSYAREAEALSGPTFTRLADIAAAEGVWLLAGSHVEDLAASAESGVETPAQEGYANTSVLYSPSGERSLVYRKHHLFGYESAESDLLTAGERLETAEVGGFTVGVTTCYDLRFPALYRRLVDDGVTLVLVPSAWPYPRVEHWRVLPQARAVENQCYVAAANGVGSFEAAELLGRSTVYDPWGNVVSGAGETEETIHAALDPGRVETVRSEFPALDDRR